MSTVVFKFKTRTEKRGRIRLQPFDKAQGRPGEKKEIPVGSTPRITKLMVAGQSLVESRTDRNNFKVVNTS